MGAGEVEGWAMGSPGSQQASRAASVGSVSQTQHTGEREVPHSQGSGPAPGRDCAFSLGETSPGKEVMGRHWSGPGTVSQATGFQAG